VSKLTPGKAAKDLRYIATQREAGRLTVQLEDIERHRLGFLEGRKACRRCGRPLTDEVSIGRGYGSECYYRLAPDEHPNDRRAVLHDAGMDDEAGAA
jgi:hypothetical protein